MDTRTTPATAETSRSTAFDVLTVTVRDTAGTVLGTLASYSNLDASAASEIARPISPRTDWVPSTLRRKSYERLIITANEWPRLSARETRTR
jgi:hypothetical protein